VGHIAYVGTMGSTRKGSLLVAAGVPVMAASGIVREGGHFGARVQWAVRFQGGAGLGETSALRLREGSVGVIARLKESRRQWGLLLGGSKFRPRAGSVPAGEDQR